VESSGYQGIFYFFSGSRTIFGAGSETIFVLYFSLLTVLRIRDVYPVSNKILNYLSSEVIKKILVNFQRIIELFVYGPGIRNKPIPDPGSRGQKGTLSRIRIRIKSIRIRIRGEGGGAGMVADPVPDWTGWLIQRDTDPGYRDQDPRPIHLRAY
jgi:hypothetical protein